MSSVPLLLLFPSYADTTATQTVDDIIYLGGQAFAIKGVVTGQPISEFEAGVKVGPATNDEREHAFFQSLNDWSGGFGERITNVREQLGTFWDSDPDNSPDTSRSGHVTLPLAQSTITPTAPGFHNNTNSTPSNPVARHAIANPSRQWVLGFGDSIYTSTDGDTWTRRKAAGGGVASVQSIVPFNAWDGAGYTYHLYAFLAPSVVDETSGAARYLRSTDGITWTNGADDMVLWDGIVWDKKLLAVYQRSSIIFSVLDESGDETWNIDDDADGEPITEIAGDTIVFIGSADAPWGEQAVYFRDSTKLYVLDFFNRTHHVINLGAERMITASCLWNGDVVVTDGWNVLEYAPASRTIRNIGLPRKNGVPPSMRGALGGTFTITALLPTEEFLFAVVTDYTDNTSRLMCYNVLGWSQVGASFTQSTKLVTQCFFPSSGQPTSRSILVVGATDPASTTMKIESFHRPLLHNVPIVGVDTFGTSGANFTSGWFDGGFADFDGTLLRMSIDAFNLSTTSTVKIEYQINNDESSAWTQMVDTTNIVDVFDSATDNLYFEASTPLQGIQFRTVRFRITLTRGSTATDSPELQSLTLIYIKTPNLRTSWTFQVDCNRMIERSAGTDDTFFIDGLPATMSRIWEKLKTLWNTHPLLELTIPNIETGLNVKLTDMPFSFDDFRDAVDGRGVVTVTCLEPVN